MKLFRFLSRWLFVSMVLLAVAAPVSLRAQSQSTIGTFTLFHGSGLLAAALTSNNWSTAAGFGGLSGSYLVTNGVPLRNSPLGIDLLVQFNCFTNGAPTNTQFFFALSPDGTNYTRDPGQMLVANSMTTATQAGNTNGYWFRAAFTQAQLGNSRGIRYERLVNNSGSGISNVVIRYSYFY